MENENLPYHLKYRPDTLDMLIGQSSVVASLKELLTKKNRPQAFIFCGNSGCGKTTTARILAKEFGCATNNIIEIDAATNNGAEDMRELIAGLRYTTIGNNPMKFIIIDECHAISAAGWKVLLKTIEEPKSHVVFALCTTELEKVPKTIQTRCHTYTLKDVKSDDLMDLLEFVATEEKIELPKGSLELIAKESQGSPRQALVYLSQVRGCTTKEEVAEMLHTAMDSSEAVTLCRLLIGAKNKEWREIIQVIKNLETTGIDAESLRITMMNYFKVCAMNGKTEEEVINAIQLLDIFSYSINRSTGFSEIILRVGQLFFGDKS